MKKLFGIVLFLFGFCLNSMQAQSKQDILVKIGEENVTADEFLKAYEKNNRLDTASEASLREYLDLYINFKMKVQEGNALQLDTSRRFKMELSSYQKQSSQQFLIDKEVTEELVSEAIDRAKQNIRASHILINCGENASPKDTLSAYQKAISIRNEILNGSISFADAAVKYSDDPSARDMVNPQTNRLHHGNKGDLGYFTVFDLIYPFETAAYNTKVGEISMPVRTKFGYHLIQVVDKIPAIQDITIAQIFITDSLAKGVTKSIPTAQKLAEIQDSLKRGVDFESLVAKYTDDKNSIEKGGMQEPFALNSRQGDFVRAILNLKEGEVSEPLHTQFGWHIVKLVGIKPVVIDEDMAYNIRSRCERDSRSHKSKDAFINRLKKEYNYNESGREKAIKFFLKNMPDEFFQMKDADMSNTKGIDKLKPMATFADQTITAKEYAKEFKRYRGINLSRNEFLPFLEERFDIYLQKKLMTYENSRLMDKYPELRDLVKEFHDGMVLYEINTSKVWAAAVQDSTGLENFYEMNKANYVNPDTQEVKPLSEIRAIVITDYQEYLDEKWISELRKKYNPVVDEKVFSQLLKK